MSHKDPSIASSSYGGGSRVLKEPKTSSISNGRKRLHSRFTDDSEMIEEYDVVTDELLLRKTRKQTTVGGEGSWVVEVGSDGRQGNIDRDLIVEAAGAPQLTRQDTAEEYVYKIRNVPYKKEVFEVSVEKRSGNPLHSIVVRTSNKKYFKVIDIPDLQRGSIDLDPANLSWDVKYDALTIKYKKPMSMRIVEAQEKKERAAIQSTRGNSAGGDDGGCKQQ